MFFQIQLKLRLSKIMHLSDPNWKLFQRFLFLDPIGMFFQIQLKLRLSKIMHLSNPISKISGYKLKRHLRS